MPLLLVESKLHRVTLKSYHGKWSIKATGGAE
jgi:hypothetical protein